MVMVKVWNKIGKFFVTFNLVRVAIANVRWIELIYRPQRWAECQTRRVTSPSRLNNACGRLTGRMEASYSN